MKRSNKEQLFDKVINENEEMLIRLCRAYLFNKSEVDDLYQEILINTWNNLEKFEGKSKLSTWIYRIAVNTVLMHNKKQKRTAQYFENDVKLKQVNVFSDDSDNERESKIQALYRSIQKLKEQDRILISLVLEGLSYDEISDILGISLSNVGVKINRVKSKLSQLMKEESHA